MSRPSGARSYAVMVTPLIAAPGKGGASEAVVAIFIADPSARFFAGPEALTELYQLTYSEAELVRLLASGLSLEEAADTRGVTSSPNVSTSSQRSPPLRKMRSKKRRSC